MPEGVRAHQGGTWGDRQLAAVGSQHPADLVDHQAMFMLILAGRQQIPGHPLVLLGPAAALGRARKRVGEDLSPADPQQQLGAGPKQSAALTERQGEVEGVRILSHQTGQHPLGVGGLVQGEDQLARQHHLGKLALGERIQRRTHRGLEFNRSRGALHRDDAVGLGGPLFWRDALPPLIAAGHIEAGGFRRIEGEGTDEQGVGLASGPGGIEGPGYLLRQQGPVTGWGRYGLTQVIGTKAPLA
ncbi:hypothetical protein D3C87_1237120 [compost metagenome]